MTAFDREKARAVLIDVRTYGMSSGMPEAVYERALDALAACVVPTTPDIDREALMALGYEWLDPYGIDGKPTEHAQRIVNEFADQILALVRPAAGIILTPDDVEALDDLLDDIILRAAPTSSWGMKAQAISKRLEAASS